MTLSGTSHARRWALAVSAPALAAAWVANTGTASAAPVFDVDAYTACTATTAPGPDQDFDGVVINCCVQNAGVPAPTRYGMGCVASMDAVPAGERPTIVLPMRPAPPDDLDAPLP